MVGPCTAAGCYLSQQHGSLVSLPLVTVAGLVDGINPCAIGMLLMLLGYLIVFARKPQAVLRIGLIYIASVFLTYLTIGLVFYELASLIQASPVIQTLNHFLGIILLLLGVWQLKDFFLPGFGPALAIPSASKDWIQKYVEKTTSLSTAILGSAVTILETPCSLPVYVGTATILAHSRIGQFKAALYFLYYNFLFVLPLIILLIIVWKTKQVISLSEWRHRVERWMHFALGIIMIIMGVWLLR